MVMKCHLVISFKNGGIFFIICQKNNTKDQFIYKAWA